MIQTYESAELFLKRNPDLKELMIANLISFESGILQITQAALKEFNSGKQPDEQFFIKQFFASQERVKKLHEGNMRPDLDVE